MAHLLFSRFRPLTINIKFKNIVSVNTSHRYLKSTLGFEIKFKRTGCASRPWLICILVLSNVMALYSPRKIETMINIIFDFWGNENKSIQ